MLALSGVWGNPPVVLCPACRLEGVREQGRRRSLRRRCLRGDAGIPLEQSRGPGEAAPVGYAAVSLVRLASVAHRRVKVGLLLRLVLRFAQVADGAQAVGATVAVFGEQDVRRAEVLVGAAEAPMDRLPFNETDGDGVPRKASGDADEQDR